MRQLVALATPEMDLIKAHAKRITNADRAVSGLFGAPLNLHCRVANIFSDRVLIQADSAAWAVKARYLSRQIVDTLNRQTGERRYSTCTVKVTTIPASTITRVVEKRELTAVARAALLDFAAYSRDESLKLATKALARSGSEQ